MLTDLHRSFVSYLVDNRYSLKEAARRAEMLRVYGPVCPTSGICAATDAEWYEKKMIG